MSNEIFESSFSTDLLKEYSDTTRDAQAAALQSGNAFILTEDIRKLIARIPNTTVSTNALERFTQETRTALTKAFNTNSLIVADEATLYGKLAVKLAQVSQEAENDGGVVINLDRFIDNPYLLKKSYARLSMGRFGTSSGEKLRERLGDPPLREQISEISSSLKERGSNKVTFIDDGLSTIDALEPYVTIAQKEGWQIKQFILGVGPFGEGEWNSVPEAKKLSEKAPFVVLPAKNPLDWVCQRDVTVFGGKMWVKNQTLVTTPYFYPFSNGASASLPSEKLIEISKSILIANINLLNEINLNRTLPLKFLDCMAAGYGLPASNLETIRTPNPEEYIQTYLEEALNTL